MLNKQTLTAFTLARATKRFFGSTLPVQIIQRHWSLKTAAFMSYILEADAL